MAGTLSAIGVLDDGNLTLTALQAYLDSVNDALLSGVVINNPLIASIVEEAPGGNLITKLNTPLALLTHTFFSDPTDYPGHLMKFTGYHEIFDPMYQDLANFFDKIPAAAVLKPIVFDPTEPLVIIISFIEEKVIELQQLVPVIPDIMTRFINYIMKNIATICAAIAGFIAAALGIIQDAIKDIIDFFISLITDFLEALKDAFEPVIDMIDAVITAISDLITKIDEWIDEIKQKIIDALIKIFMPPLPTLPDISPYFNFKLPLFKLKGLGLPAIPMMPPIQFKLDIFKKIIEIILMLPTLVGKLIQAIMDGIMSVIKFLMEVIIVPLVELIIQYLGGALAAVVVPIASLGVLLSKIVPMFIVSILGYLLGPGLITDGVARALGLK